MSIQDSCSTEEPGQLIERHSFVFLEEKPVGLSEEASLPRGFRKELFSFLFYFYYTYSTWSS